MCNKMGNLVLTGAGDCLLDTNFQDRLLWVAILKQSLQVQGSEHSFELSPILLAGVVVGEVIGHIPDGRDLQVLEGLANLMGFAVVQEQMDRLSINCKPQKAKKHRVCAKSISIKGSALPTKALPLMALRI